MPTPANVQPYVFISYASADRERVLPIVDRLEQAGVKTWIDRDGIHGGANYAKVISDAVKEASALVLMASPASLESRNVRQELALGWRYERPYLPLLLDPIEIPDDLAYWLEGSQWIEVLNHSERVWLAKAEQALTSLGITCQVDVERTTTSPRERQYLAGRQQELTLLNDCLASLNAGTGSVALISGEAGVGKTALAVGVLEAAQERGFTVLEGHCFDLAETPPYGPWIDLFAHCPLVIDEPLPNAFAIRGTVGSVPTQLALFGEVEEFLHRLARRKPIVVLLDDLHWSDPASLDLLHYLARSGSDVALLILVTFRSDELTRRDALFGLLPKLGRLRGSARINLTTLDDDAIRELIEYRYSLRGVDIDRLATYLEMRSGGNALFINELLRTLEEVGDLTAVDGTWQLGELNERVIPPLLRDVIEGRAARFDDQSRRLLEIASVIAQTVPIEVWATVAEVDEETIVDLAERAEAAGLVEASPDSMSVRFHHALIREALYDDVRTIRRRRLHQRVGDVLSRESQPDPDAVAMHYQQAGDLRAVPWLIKAGDRARRSGAVLTAVERYESALTLMDFANDSQSEEKAWLLLKLASAHRRVHPQQSLECVEAAATIASKLENDALDCAVHYLLGTAHTFLGDIDAGIVEWRTVLEPFHNLSAMERDRVEEAVDSSADAMRATLTLYLAASGRNRETLDAMEQTAVSDPPMSYMWFMWFLAAMMAHAQLGNPEPCEDLFQRACGEGGAFRPDAGQLAFNCLLYLEMVVLPFQADQMAARTRVAERGEQAWHRALAIIPEYQPPEIAWLPLFVIDGRWNELASVIPRLGAFNASHRAVIDSVVGPFLMVRGDLGGAWERVRGTLPEGATTKPGAAIFFVAMAMQRLATSLLLEGRQLDEARVWLESQDRWLDWSSAVLGRAEGALLWAQYHHACGDQIVAREYADKSLAHASEPRQPLALITAHRFLGLLDTEEQRFAEADKHLQESLRVAEACAAPFERALTLLEMARLRVAQGNTDEARELLAEVRAVCEPLDAKPTLQKVADLLQQLGASEVSDA